MKRTTPKPAKKKPRRAASQAAPASLADQLRQAMALAKKERGISRYQIAKATDGVLSEAVLSRFFNGKRSITIEQADMIARAIGVTIEVG